MRRPNTGPRAIVTSVVRTLDRYVIRETLPPFLLALGLFTFVLAINPMLEYAKDFLAKGVPVTTVAVLLLTLIPQAMSLTLPMAFLTGVLMALGRLSGDREAVALLSCGIGPLRLLRPLLVLAVLIGLADMYVLMKVKPDANQTFRDIGFRHLEEQTENEIKPRIFFERFPGIVLYIGDTARGGGWTRVLFADTTDPIRPTVTLADSGRLDIDRDQRAVWLIMNEATQYRPGPKESRTYTTTAFSPEPLTVKVTAEAVFGSGELSYPRGYPEMSYADLRRAAEMKRAQGESPHN